MTEVLTTRALNRALLARQLLLERAARPVADAVEHLVGLQAQSPKDPYVALWSRLDGFDPHELSDLMERREVVRIALMRSTIHTVTARDALALRPLLQGVSERQLKGQFGRQLEGVDRKALARQARRLVERQPLTFGALGKRLAEAWPGRQALALSMAARVELALVQVPPRGLWGRSGQAAHTTVEHWLGRRVDAQPSLDDLVLRYLGAFGPATVMDIQQWSGLTRLREVVDRLRPRLVTFASEGGKELFDLPDAPRPDPATPAPPRFLPEYDNLLLSHTDRGRAIPPGHDWTPLLEDGRSFGTVLVDGFVEATWRLERERRAATLVVRPFAPLADEAAVVEEGERLLAFLAADATQRALKLQP